MGNLQDTKGENWDEFAKIYKDLTVGTSRKPIGALLEKANSFLPFSEATGVLDNGCGPGPIISRLLKDYRIPDGATLTCSDFSDGMLQQVRNTKQEQVDADGGSPWSRVEVVLQNAMDLDKVKDDSLSHVTAGWVYFMTPSPDKCLEESKRVLKTGGVLACSSWQGSQWMDMMNLAPTIKPDINMPKMPPDWENVGRVKGNLEKAGFRDVESIPVTTQLDFDSRESLIKVLLGMPPMIPVTKSMSDDEVERLRKVMDEGIKSRCPSEPGQLEGVAIVAVGRK